MNHSQRSRPGVFVKTATLELPYGLLVERLEGRPRVCERPRYGCEPADVRSLIDRGLLCRAPSAKCVGEVGPDRVRNAGEILIFDELADSAEQFVLLWRR